MKALAIDQPGPHSRLVLCDRPRPAPGPGEVLIKVRTAGINRADLMQRAGHYPPPPGASDLPGLEVSGVVIEEGANVHWPKRGQPVCALLSGGGYAEYCRASAALCLPAPEGLSLEDAGGLPEALFTLWDNLFRRGGASAGETLLIQGGTGGIGSLAIPLTQRFGLRVLATAGTAEKCAVLARWGAAPINYRDEDFAQRVLALTENSGVDVILDLVGADYLEAHLKLLKEGGRLVLIAVQSGYRASINLLPILTRRLILTGSTLRQRSLEDKTLIATALSDRVWPLLGEGGIKPTIAAVFEPTQAEEAHRLLQSGQSIGKILLRFGD